MNKSYILTFVFLFIFCMLANADLLPKAVLLPSDSVAIRDDALATTINPAGLAVNSGFNGCYFHTISDKFGGNDAYFLSNGGIGFGAEYVANSSLKFRKYSLSDSIKIADGIYLGTVYSWFNSGDKDYDKLSSWDIGLLSRPSNTISIGIVARNLNHPSFKGIRTDRTYDFSLALRPYTDRITLAVNSTSYEGRKISDSTTNVSINFEPLNGVMISGRYDNNRRFEVSVGLGFPKLEFGSYRSYDEDQKSDGGGIYLNLSNDWNRSIFGMRHYVMEMKNPNPERILKAKNDNAIDGIIIKSDIGEYGMGTAQEIRDAISDFRSSGKKIICYMEMAGNKEYYIASACDKVYLNNVGTLNLYGLRSEFSSYKGLLDKLGVKADLYRIGKYKSATEMLTDETMSDAHRESLSFVLDDLHNQMVNGIADNRKVSSAKVQEWIDKGPYTASEAKESNIVDDLIYADQIDDSIKQVMGRKVVKISDKEYENRKYHRYDWKEKPKIAVIYASGLMLPGRSMFGESALVPSIMGSDTITSAIKEARENDSIKAIVFRIDSGGGSVFASDLIWREVMLTKGKKPFIVSMGDVSASGGYYIACPADVIVADPGTITGSIGIITGKMSLRGLYDKLGIKKEIIKKGENSDIYTDYDSFNDQQKEIVERQMREMYQSFVSKVAQGRNLKEDYVDSIGQGRVWTGKQAKENGLVDRIGGLNQAILIAGEKASLKDKSPDIIELPKRELLWQRLAMENQSLLNNIKSLLYLPKIEDALSNNKFYFLMPYVLDYK
jgi:protease-4